MTLLEAERTFVPYGPSHWALLVLLLVGAVVLGVFGYRARGTRGSRVFARLFAVVVVTFHLSLLVHGLLPGHWDIHSSLPIHLSDLSWMAAAVALWTRHRWAHALTYYWGLTLVPQSAITPALDSPDFPHPEFIEFWGLRLLVVWAAVYLTWGMGLRPNWVSYGIAIGGTVGWGVAAFVFNRWAGTNYGFLNNKPENPSLLDVMGGWPWYLLVAFAVGLIVWALLTWPWTWRRQGSSKPS